MNSKAQELIIYHNPQCGTSRNTLALIRNTGVEPQVIEYLVTPPSREVLTGLIESMGITPRALLREKGTPYDELDLGNPKWTDEQVIDHMMTHPILINRPIVVSPLGTKLCRPSELVLDLLPIRQTLKVRRLGPAVSEEEIRGLVEVLRDCVDGGASVSFMQPLSIDKAQSFWRQVAEGVFKGERALLVAEDASGIVGTVQLILAQPDNQPHRADLSKMLVHRRARRMGVGALLLQAAQSEARDCAKTLLVLDTANAEAERLYVRHGWQRCGVIPGYALRPEGGLCDTTIYYLPLLPSTRDLHDGI
jgi:arsenate reductase (glutaredoxin)